MVSTILCYGSIVIPLFSSNSSFILYIMTTINTKLIQDLRIRSLTERTLDKHFNKTFTELDLEKYSECLIKETVRECMKQIAMPVNMDDYTTMNIVEKQWEFLIKRFDIILNK